MNRKYITLFLILFIFTFSFLTIVKAQSDNFGTSDFQITGYDNLEGGEIAGKINKFYQTAIILGGIAAVIVIVIGGVMYSVSGAINKKNEGKEIIISAISGLVLLLLAFVILNTINPELVNLRDPAGVEGITSFDEGSLDMQITASCDTNTGLDECEDGESPELNDEGVFTCCINSNSFCSPETIEDCSLDGTTYEFNVFPKCYDSNGNEITNGLSCDGGTIECDGGNDIKCVDGDNNEVSVSNACVELDGDENQPVCFKEIEVPNCDTCAHWLERWERKTIYSGGKYFESAYYPMNGDPNNKWVDSMFGKDGVKCLIYAFKTHPNGEIEYADLGGLKHCKR